MRAPASSMLERHTPDARSNRRRTVLVTCVDEDTRRICEHCLKHAGYEVHVVEDPDTVMSLGRAARPDVIITSYPTYTSLGVPVTVLVRRDAVLAHTPVLNLASWALQDDLAVAAADGVSESLPMPILLEDLLEAVDRLARGEHQP